MNADPYAPPGSSSRADNDSNNPNIHSIVVNVLKWLQWSILTILTLMVFMFAYRIDPDKDHWSLNLTGIVILVLFLPLSLFVGLFLLKKVTRPWLNLITYGFGLLVTFLLISCGFFAVLSGDYTLILAGVMALLLYCPLISNKPTGLSKKKRAGKDVVV